MCTTIESQISGLSDSDLVRLAHALYDPAEVPDATAFEADPPTVADLLVQAASLAGVDGVEATRIADEAAARGILLDMASRDDGRARIAPLLERVGEETMSSPGETVVLVVIVLAALRDLVELEIDNQGKKGALRWRLRLGGRGGVPPEIARSRLRDWLTRVAASSAQLPETREVDLEASQGQDTGR